LFFGRPDFIILNETGRLAECDRTRRQPMKDRMEIIEGDITKLKVDAIVNAANKTLLGGGGVDGAIHRAAGPELLKECRGLNGCETGQAKITRGYKLPAKWVIHTVGPVWRGGTQDEAKLLADCYKNSFALAGKNDIRIIAFPAISTGVYGYPVDRAARIALYQASAFLTQNRSIEKVVFVCFGEAAYRAHKEALDEVLGTE
jgi:O-acetyl-ADP-ribose deacetylase (regulator of RNase III)